VKTLDKFTHIAWPNRLSRVISDLHDQLLETYPSGRDGTTAIIVYIPPFSQDPEIQEIYVACLGDARAMIINTKNGEILKVTDHGSITICETLDYKSSSESKASGKTDYITRAHIFDGDKDNIEYKYYTEVKKLKFIAQGGGVYYLKTNDGIALQPLRSIGDFNVRSLIRTPELYTWKIPKEQLKYSTLLVVSDGFDNHEALIPSKLATLISNPHKFFANPMAFTDGIFLRKFNYIKPDDIKSTTIIGTFKNILDKLQVVIKNDDNWIKTMQSTYLKFVTLFESLGISPVPSIEPIEPTSTSEPSTTSTSEPSTTSTSEPSPISEPSQSIVLGTTLQLAIYVSILLGSEDNICALGTNLAYLNS
jgi:serine/threonine protein phosphatase PrpC